jgi:hypothetical protein
MGRMTGESVGERTGRGPWLSAQAAVLALALLLRTAGADIPLERDEGEYAYMAWRWLEGEVPYVETFDQKPPAIFAAYALIIATLGGSPSAIHWGAQLQLLLALLVLMQLGRKLFGPAVGVGAGLLAAVATTGPAMFANAANTEIFALLPLIAGLALSASAARRDDLRLASLAGVCAGVALLFKWVVAPILVLQVVFHLFWSPLEAGRRLRHILVLALGAAAVLGLTIGYFAWVGGLAAMIDATLVYNFSYATSIPLGRYPEVLAAQLGQARPVLLPLALAALLSPLARVVSGSDASGDAARRNSAWVWAWLGASILAASAGGYFRPHYFLLTIPPLCLLAALGVSDMLDALGSTSRRKWAGVIGLAVLLLAQSVWATPWYYRSIDPMTKARRIYEWNPFPESVAIGRFIAEHSEPDDRVFVFGSEPQIYYYARRRSATRFIYTYPLSAPPDAALGRQREVLASLRSAPPRFIVGVFLQKSLSEEEQTPTILRDGLRALVAERYRPVGIVPQRGDGQAEVKARRSALRSLADGSSFSERETQPRLVVWERS